MNNRRFRSLLTLDDPEGHYQIDYIINCWNNRRTALTDTCRGEIMGAVKVGGRQDLRSRLLKCATVEDDDAFCRLIYQFTVNKMILKYQSE